MKNFKFINASLCLILLFITSCSNFIKTAERPELGSDPDRSQMYERVYVRSGDLEKLQRGDSKLNSDLEKYAYELGLDPRKDLTQSEIQEIKQRRLLRTLERDLDTEKERYNYSKVLPLFKNDSEKIEYLNIKSIEGKQAWINKHKIWERERKISDYQEIIQNQDIAVGMSQDIVRRSWGEPQSIDISGNPIYKNERWKYIREMPTSNGYKRERRYVYFEGGKVVGWETE
ncbi:MAG: hypothetical protein ACK4VO_08790 [Pseudobdellovibrio sp.]